MTITIDQLIQILMKEETDDAGVRAVVTALRDEMCGAQSDDERSPITLDTEQLWQEFQEILASDGTHGSPELDEDARKLEAMGQDAGPTVQDLFPEAFAPAAAPVCEWTPRKYEMGFYATPHGIKFKDRRYDNCGICGLPIAIKSEAAR